MTTKKPQLIIISGRSGAGKSVSLHALEDLGFYCVDGLPLSLLDKLIAILANDYQKIAVSIDARNLPNDYHRLEQLLQEMAQQCTKISIIYLKAADDVLLKRYSETRRKHPLADAQISLAKAVQYEQDLLQPLYRLADVKIDTTRLSTHELHRVVTDSVMNDSLPPLTLLFQSFGYKFGLPQDSDFLFDVRCLPNPYWEPHLRKFCGFDEPLIAFFQDKADAIRMIQQINNYISDWLPAFESNHRNYVTISIGCTGGRHRSVFVAEQLAEGFKTDRSHVQVRHREL